MYMQHSFVGNACIHVRAPTSAIATFANVPVPVAVPWFSSSSIRSCMHIKLALETPHGGTCMRICQENRSTYDEGLQSSSSSLLLTDRVIASCSWNLSRVGSGLCCLILYEQYRRTRAVENRCMPPGQFVQQGKFGTCIYKLDQDTSMVCLPLISLPDNNIYNSGMFLFLRRLRPSITN